MNYTWLWKLDTLNKIKIFLWVVVHNRLPTSKLLFNRKIIASSLCNICMSEEDMEHMLFNYLHSKPIWDQLDNSYKYSNQSHNDFTIHNWVKLQCQSKSKFNRYIGKADIMPVILWHIWTHKNNYIFNNKKNPLLLEHIVNNTILYKLLTTSKKKPCPKMIIYIK